MPPANTLVRWVNECAFTFIMQARPCPTFGRPVHLRGSPHRLRPGTSPHALRIPPRGGHPAIRSHLLSGRRGVTPAFGYDTPHPGARGTLTLLIHALPSAHYALLRLLTRLPPGLRFTNLYQSLRWMWATNRVRPLLLQRSSRASHLAAPAACYVASWQLPRPDLHRLADDDFQDTPARVRRH